MDDEKIQKVLSRAGLGSRREIEQWLREGGVSVNGQVAKLGDRITGREQIRVRGTLLESRSLQAFRPRVLIYNKPEGEICTRSDPEGRPTVFSRIPRIARGRWVMIGRLDINTSGLLMFTDDGHLANALMHPSAEVEREYAVRVLGEVTREQLKQLTTGVELEDGPAVFSSLVMAGGEGANQWYHVVIREGRNREVRRLWEAVGLRVSRLIRVRYGVVNLPRDLHLGEYRYLEADEVDLLYQEMGLPVPGQEASAPQRSKAAAAPAQARGRVAAGKRPVAAGRPGRRPAAGESPQGRSAAGERGTRRPAAGSRPGKRPVSGESARGGFAAGERARKPRSGPSGPSGGRKRPV